MTDEPKRRRSGWEKDEGVIPPLKKRPRYVGAQGSIRATSKELAEAEREGREIEIHPEHGANPWTDFDFPEAEGAEDKKEEAPRKRSPRESD